MGRQKGDRRERQLANEFQERGYAVLRSPASGSATERELPDLFVARHGDVYAIEVKASSGDPIYIDEEKIVALKWFAKHFECEAVVAGVFDEKPGDPGEPPDPTWGKDMPGAYFLLPGMLHRTQGGNYRLKKDLALEEGRLITELY